jgi:hypothetical protein
MLRRTLLASTLAASVAACAPQPMPYTLYRVQPGIVWPGSATALPQPVPPVVSPVDLPNTGDINDNPPPVPVRRHYQQSPVANDDVPDTPVPAPAYPRQTVRPAIPPPEPPASSSSWGPAGCSGWWDFCHFL